MTANGTPSAWAARTFSRSSSRAARRSASAARMRSAARATSSRRGIRPFSRPRLRKPAGFFAILLDIRLQGEDTRSPDEDPSAAERGFSDASPTHRSRRPHRRSASPGAGRGNREAKDGGRNGHRLSGCDSGELPNGVGGPLPEEPRGHPRVAGCITFLDRYRWRKAYTPCCWHFDGHIGNSTSWNARWSFRAFTQGKFVWLGPSP
jgi:hypothetical protein